MAELDEVLAALEAGTDEVALATIVGVQGSTYRREGARLVIPPDGPLVGNISGGCLEGDVAAGARVVLSTGRPEVLHFDLTADDEAVWGWGLGCNGAIDVLVEPASAAQPFIAALRSARREHRPVALVTAVDGPHIGQRLIVDADGRAAGALDERARDLALAALRTGRGASAVLAPDGPRVVVEVFRPPLRLIVCGAGHDVVPLVEFGTRLGWRVEVVDDRTIFLTPDRFPAASRFVVTPPGSAAEAVRPDAGDFVVVMSHNFLRDADYLRSFLATPVAYLGVLGPHARLTRLLDAAGFEGVALPPGAVAAIHGPAGLDIGAEGPEEVAWAIVAEILAVQHAAGGGFLRDREGPIHPRSSTEAGPASGNDRRRRAGSPVQ